MDDTQDKVRRNLVVFSAAIVIGWFLNLKLTDIAKPFVSTNIADVDAVKLWIVILVVLIYLFLRYRFDASTNSQIVSLFDELKVKGENYLNKYLLRIIDRINRTSKFSPIFSASLADFVNNEREAYEKQHSEKFSFRLNIPNPWHANPLVDPNKPKSMWTGTLGLSVEYFREGSPHKFIISTGPHFDFSIPLSGRIWISAHSLIHLVFYSKSAVDLVVPMILAGLAALVAICKLINLVSFPL